MIPVCLGIFKSRLSCVKIFLETVKINRDCRDFQDLSRLFKIDQDILTYSRLFEGLQAHRFFYRSTTAGSNLETCLEKELHFLHYQWKGLLAHNTSDIKTNPTLIKLT
jgi:hypothetical protein